MFIRKKKNRSGTVSIVIVDKHNGKFKELHTVGIAKCEEDIAPLMHEGRKWIDSHLGVQCIDLGFYEKISDNEQDGNCQILEKSF